MASITVKIRNRLAGAMSASDQGCVYLLRTVPKDGRSYDRFRWPLTVGAEVSAPDPDRTAVCGGGLHGLPGGVGEGGLLDWSSTARWLVFSAAREDVIDIDGAKSKSVGICRVEFVGDREDATRHLVEVCGCPNHGIVGGTATAGDRGTATVGYRGTATAGYEGTATAGDRGTATVGYRGTATAGYEGTATVGDEGTATAGDEGTATAGYMGTATVGDGGTATVGDGGTATAGDEGTATAGDEGTATAGYMGTATAGYEGVVVVAWWDGRRRYAIGYVGEDGIEPGVAYRVEAGKLVRA